MNQELSFGQFLQAKRKETGMTIREVADEIGISPLRYCRVERDERAPSGILDLDCVSHILELSPDDDAMLRNLAAKACEDVPSDEGDDEENVVIINISRVTCGLILQAVCRTNDGLLSEEDWRDFLSKTEK